MRQTRSPTSRRIEARRYPLQRAIRRPPHGGGAGDTVRATGLGQDVSDDRRRRLIGLGADAHRERRGPIWDPFVSKLAQNDTRRYCTSLYVYAWPIIDADRSEEALERCGMAEPASRNAERDRVRPFVITSCVAGRRPRYCRPRR